LPLAGEAVQVFDIGRFEGRVLLDQIAQGGHALKPRTPTEYGGGVRRRSNVRRVRHAATLCVAALLALTGCGFVSSGQRGSSKPDGFTLRGYVSVSGGLIDGAACTAPATASDVHEGSAVRVADAEGHTLGAGELSAGVADAASGRCNFGFQIAAVPGGVDQYVIGVGSRPAVAFPAHDLRSDKPAVITVDV
jgi:hypothetical protein